MKGIAMYLERISAPAIEPVSVQEMKQHLRLDHDEEDGLLAGMVVAARRHLEKRLSLAFLSARWRYRADKTPRGRAALEVPLFPLASVQQVRLYLEDGTTALADLANMQVRSAVRPAIITGVRIPFAAQPAHGAEIEFTAGYGDAPEDVPEQMRLAIRLLAAHFYENRVEMPGCVMPSMPASVSLLLMDVMEVRLI